MNGLGDWFFTTLLLFIVMAFCPSKETPLRAALDEVVGLVEPVVPVLLVHPVVVLEESLVPVVLRFPVLTDLGPRFAALPLIWSLPMRCEEGWNTDIPRAEALTLGFRLLIMVLLPPLLYVLLLPLGAVEINVVEEFEEVVVGTLMAELLIPCML